MNRLDSVEKGLPPLHKPLLCDSGWHPETAEEIKGARSGGEASYKKPLPPYRTRQRPGILINEPPPPS